MATPTTELIALSCCYSLDYVNLAALRIPCGLRLNNLIQSELVGEVRGHAEIPFGPADIVDIKVTHNKWDFQKERRG